MFLKVVLSIEKSHFIGMDRRGGTSSTFEGKPSFDYRGVDHCLLDLPRESQVWRRPKQNSQLSATFVCRGRAVPCDLSGFQSPAFFGRLIFIHLRCWEVLPFLTNQHQWCINKGPEFYTPLALKCQKGQHLPQHRRCIKISLPFFLLIKTGFVPEVIAPSDCHCTLRLPEIAR